MSAERPHARKAAAGRARRRRGRSLLPILVPLGLVAVAAIVAFALVAGGGDDSGERAAPGSPEQLAEGAEVFEQSCQTCHGPEARGGLAGPPLIHEIYAPDHHPDQAFRTAVAQGVQPHHWDFAGMPPIPGLDDADVEAVIAYVRSLQREAWGGDTP